MGLLIGQEYIKNNAYSAFQNFNKLNLSKEQLSLPKPQLYQLVSSKLKSSIPDNSTSIVPVRTKKNIGFSWAMSFSKDKPNDINIVVDNINSQKPNISFATNSLLPKITKSNKGLLLFISLLYLSHGNKAKKYFDKLVKSISNKKKRRKAIQCVRAITRQGDRNEKSTKQKVNIELKEIITYCTKSNEMKKQTVNEFVSYQKITNAPRIHKKHNIKKLPQSLEDMIDLKILLDTQY